MKRIFFLVCAFFASVLSLLAQENKPLRVFIRAGEKTHGPGQHDHPRFLADWKTLLNQRGAQADGAMTFPTAEQLQNTDVLVMFCAEGGTISSDERANLQKFLERGGGIVVIHDAVCGKDPAWFKTIVGGAWEHGKSKFFEGNISLYYQDHEHPITKGASNFDFDDEMYYDLQIEPGARVLAATYQPDERHKKGDRLFPSVFDIVPQMWVYEKSIASGSQPYRAFVSIPGHNYKSFDLPHYRAILLRGIAWVGKREADSLCSKEELASLLYPEGGPVAPEKSAAKISLPGDFTVNLVAAEPLIEKPISHDWDAQGRLWIAETPEYPAGRHDPNGNVENRPAHDRISIIEGAGNLLTKKVFFDGLELVTSFVFYKDGVIVAQAPDVLWIRDTDGDGKADKKETLYTGFGTRDTHAVISNMRWGQDGWIYMTLGYSGGGIKSGDGKKDFGGFGSGVIRFKPDGSGMEQVVSKGGNTWGLDFDWDGELFFSQANGEHCLHVVMPEGALSSGRVGGATSHKTIEDHKKSFPIRSYEKQAYVQIDNVGGFTAASGATIYNGGAWPADWNGNFFVSEPTVNLVHRDLIKPDGPSFIASKDRNTEWMASTDLWFRPIHGRIGPDGGFYVLDFYNQAVVHNDTRGPRHGPNNAAVRPDRDHFFGRIWRVQHKDAKKLDVPNLAKASPDELINALKHPNEWVRMTAHRKLADRGERDVVPALEKILNSPQEPAPARVHALWVLQNLGAATFGNITTAVNDNDPAVQKNGLRVLTEMKSLDPQLPLHFAVIQQFQSTNARVQLEALMAEAAFKPSKPAQDMLIILYPKLNNPWAKSAALNIAARSPAEFLESALSVEPEGLEEFVSQVTAVITSKQRPDTVAEVMVRLGIAPEKSDPLKRVILEKLNSDLPADFMLPWTPLLQRFCQGLLSSQDPLVAMSTLPLVARWDVDGFLREDVKKWSGELMHHLHDGDHPEVERIAMVKSMLGIRKVNADLIPSVAQVLNATNPPNLQKQVVEALGKIPEAAVAVELVTAYPKVVPEVQDAIFNQLLKRPEWTLTLLDMLAAKKIDVLSLGPLAINRLRTHADKNVAQRANAVLTELRGPEAKEKDALIAKIAPVVDEIGNPEFGHILFKQNCAVCHKFNGEGKDVAPDLTGMGVHGSRDLLVHVLDPNRVVEPNFMAVSIETKDGETQEGIIGREDKNTILLRNAAGDVEIQKSNIKSRKNTGRSLMPEGFEGLGPAAVRDILDYICSVDAKFRVLNLKSVATANSMRGIYVSQESTEETLKFKRFGVLKLGELPFEIANPLNTSSGNNVLVLKGGEGYAKTLPQKVEVPVNLKVHAFHFLGAAGWGFPWGGVDKYKGLPAAKVTVVYTNNQTEQFIFTNGVEFADYNGNTDVPGSQAVPGILEHGQVRYFARPVKDSKTPVQKLIIESFDNVLAPTFAAVTAEIEPKKRVVETIEDLGTFYPVPFGPISVSMLGGGTSHNFEDDFNVPDSVAMAYASVSPMDWTTNLHYFSLSFTNHDVLYICSNQPMTNNAVKKGIMDWAAKGKGMLLIHPAIWYNWKEWPEYNRELVGGGSNSHDKYGEIEVTITDRKHPIMQNIPKSFKVKDELYHFQPDPKGTPIEVLAIGKNAATGASYPVIWSVKHPKARIICITLGHDADTHNNIAYRVLLQNAMAWVAHKLGDEQKTAPDAPSEKRAEAAPAGK